MVEEVIVDIRVYKVILVGRLQLACLLAAGSGVGLWCSVVWCGMVVWWCGVAWWHGSVVWHGGMVVWCGMVAW